MHSLIFPDAVISKVTQEQVIAIIMSSATVMFIYEILYTISTQFKNKSNHLTCRFIHGAFMIP